MSPYARMRDPLENRELTFAGSLPLDGKPEERVLEELTDLMDDATFRIRRIRNRMLLLSFTVDATMGYGEGDEPFMRAWARARMWEQYASNHVGVSARSTARRRWATFVLSFMRSGRPPWRCRLHAAGVSGHRSSDRAAREVSRGRVEPGGVGGRARSGPLRRRSTGRPSTSTASRSSPTRPRTTDMCTCRSEALESDRAVILGEHFPQAQVPKAASICEQAGIELLMVIWASGAPRLVPSEWAVHRRLGGGFSEPLGPEDVLDLE